MNNLRAVLRLMAMTAITFVYFSVIVIGNSFSTLGFKNYDLSARMKRKWGRAITKILGMDLTVIGKIPEPPFFMVSNHLSYVDVWVLFSVLKCTFIAKSEVKSWPVIGTILKNTGILFVDRNKRRDVTRVNKEISDNLNQYQGIILFPEGTTSPGVEILPFKSSLFQFPAEFGLAVSCVAISYSTPDEEIKAYRAICWWEDISFFTHLYELLKMKGFSATVTFAENGIESNDRKELARNAELTIKRLFKPVIDPSIYAEREIGSSI